MSRVREVSLVDAVKAADKAAVRTLLHQRVDVNAPEPDGTTALHWAANRDDPELVDLLIRAGANAKAANRYGVMPLWLAAMNGNAASHRDAAEGRAPTRTPRCRKARRS